MAGFVVGFACIVAGVVLGFSGVVGHTSLTAQAIGLQANVTDAAPGVIVAIVGGVIIFMTRMRPRKPR